MTTGAHRDPTRERPLDRPRETETTLRRALGVPSDAARVLVFSESSHWDTNWLQHVGGVFPRAARADLRAILAALDARSQAHLLHRERLLPQALLGAPPRAAGAAARASRAPPTAPDVVFVHHSGHAASASRGHPSRLSSGPGLAACERPVDHASHRLLPGQLRTLAASAVADARGRRRRCRTDSNRRHVLHRGRLPQQELVSPQGIHGRASPEGATNARLRLA